MTNFFEAGSWDERYAGEGRHWSGEPNAQLVAQVSALPPGTALDVGCGEGGDAIWLARQGWQVTGADFSAAGLARMAAHAAAAGVEVEPWQIDARGFDPGGRTWDLVTSHYLHPPDGGMVEVTRRLLEAVSPGGHLLVVGHAPSELFDSHGDELRRAMWDAEGLLPALPADATVLVAERRPRLMVRDGVEVSAPDAVLLAKR